MRNTILSSLSVFMLTATMLLSCSKDNHNTSNNGILKNEQNSTTESSTGTVTLYSNVLNGILNLGAEVYTPPSTSTDLPLFSGYDRIEYYISDGVIYEVYIWTTNLDTGYPSAVYSCSKSWHDGSEPDGNGGTLDSGCYGEGSACDLELRNGNVIVICCEVYV